MSSISGIIFAILIFSFLIFVHELGHFIAAKRSGVQVNEFAMFMGPAIFKKKVGETTYSLRCIPIGGYCAMEGEDTDTDNPRSFRKAAWWKRLIILVAGSGMNLIAGFLIVLFVNCFAMNFVHTQISEVLPGSVFAQEATLQKDDILVRIGDVEINHSKALADVLAKIVKSDEANKSVKLDVVVIRDGQQVLLEDVTFERRDFVNEDGTEEKGEFGISYDSVYELVLRKNYNGILSETWDQCVYYGVAIWESLGMLISGAVGLQDMASPVGIVAIMGDVATQSSSFLSGLVQLLSLGGFIAINLGIMNLLPIPALDGGRVLSLLIVTPIEKITKKPVNPKIEAYIHAGGMILLLLFMGLIMIKDILMLFGVKL